MADKSDKKKEGKQNLFQRTGEGTKRWWRETVGELRRVSWPSWQETRRMTIIVLIVMLAMSALLGLFDFVFSQIMNLLVA